MDIPNSVELIDSHLSEFCDDNEISVLHEVESEIIHSDIYVIKPNEKRDYYILMTCGLSALPMNVPEEFDADKYIEVIILLPSTWNMNYDDFENENNYWPIRLLKELSKYPHEENTWLGYGHTFNYDDKPFSDNNKFVGVVLIDSITLSEGFINIDSTDKKVHIFSAMPLYKEELDFKKEHGTDELMKKFEKFRIEEVVNINRPNTCEK